MICLHSHFPSRLLLWDYEKKTHKPIIQEFIDSEKLFWRCDKNQTLPFQNISLVDISVNREFHGEIERSIHTDALYDISTGEIITDKDVLIIKIEKINNDKSFYHKLCIEDNTVEIILKHTPIPCMYPHCSFCFFVNGIEIDFKNYNILLGNKTGWQKRARKELRSLFRTSFYSEKIIINTQS